MAIGIAVDIMGGDHAPDAILDGVNEALDAYGDRYRLLLAGPEELIRSYLNSHGKENDSRVEVYDAPEVVGMDEHPVSAVRNKRHSSIAVCMDLVKAQKAQAVFSAGNTGAAVASSFFKWRMLKGIDRPGIATQFPTLKEPFVLLDSGATVDCTPSMLVQFALMGTVYMELVLNRPKPRVGLLSNGTEETKGCRLVQDAFKLLSETPGINFIGNVEGHGLFSGDVDVVVCDGFVGNVVLKSCEQLAATIGKLIKQSIKSNPLWAVGGLLSKGAFGVLKEKMDYSETGGAPLLGVNGVCMIGHGISDAKAVRNGIRAAANFVHVGVNERIAERVQILNV